MCDDVDLLEMMSPPVIGEQVAAGFVLDLAPELVRAHHERDVVRALADGEAGHACVAVRGAEGVRRRELVDPEDGLPAFGELVERGAAHRAQAQDQSVISLHGLGKPFGTGDCNRPGLRAKSLQ